MRNINHYNVVSSMLELLELGSKSDCQDMFDYLISVSTDYRESAARRNIAKRMAAMVRIQLNKY